MSRQQSLDVLNATHHFPCNFTIKVIGVMRDDFVIELVEAVRAGMGLDAEVPYSTRRTPAGRHMSVTLEPEVESAEQILAIYDRIRFVEGIVLTM